MLLKISILFYSSLSSFLGFSTQLRTSQKKHDKLRQNCGNKPSKVKLIPSIGSVWFQSRVPTKMDRRIRTFSCYHFRNYGESVLTDNHSKQGVKSDSGFLSSSSITGNYSNLAKPIPTIIKCINFHKPWIINLSF